MIVCLFDIDGTLLSSGGAGKAAMEAALAEVFATALKEHRVPFSGRTDRAIARDLFAAHDVADTQANWQQFMATYLRLLPDCLARHRGAVLPGVVNLLKALRQRSDCALGLLTGNVRAGARLKLQHYELFDYFDFGGFGDEHFERDHVAHAALAAARHHLPDRVDLDHCWVIGDTPLDIRCARAIGARAAAIATGWHPLAELAAANPDVLLADLSDPAPLLERWCGS